MIQANELFRSGDALLVIDVQKDFCPGGALPVENGDAVVPILNRWIAAAAEQDIPLYMSRDWHPANHISFEEQDGDWPPHCVQDSEGARFHPDLQVPDHALKVTKGVRFDQDQYSALDQTGLAEHLRERGIRRVVVGGLAEDVCVRATVLDACKAGFDVLLLADATRPVSDEDGEKARTEMHAAGARLVYTEKL